MACAVMSRASSQPIETNLPFRRARGDVRRSWPRRSRTQRRPLWQMKPRVYGLSFRPSSSTSRPSLQVAIMPHESGQSYACLLYTSDAADDLLCVDLGGRRIIKKKKKQTKTE